jgi:hypothetical protein
MIDNSDNFFIKNFPAIGLYRYYEVNLHRKFLPHFISNLLSVLFIGEMERVLNEDKLNKKKKGEINSDQIDNTKNRLLLKKKLLCKVIKKLIKKKEKKKKARKKKKKKKMRIKA